jgi:hypothetical protein
MLGLAIIAAIALRILIPRWRRRPPNKLAAIAVRPFGIQQTGPDGAWTKGDRLRAAGFSATVALGFAGLAWLGGEGDAHTANNTSANLAAAGVALLGAIGLVLAAIMSVVHLIGAAIASRVPEPPGAEHAVAADERTN